LEYINEELKNCEMNLALF